MRGCWRSCPGASRWRTGRLSAAQKVSADCVVRATFLKRRRRHRRTFPRRPPGPDFQPTSYQGFGGTISAEALDVRLIKNSILALSHDPVLWAIEKDVEGGVAQMKARLTNVGSSAARTSGRVQSWQRCMVQAHDVLAAMRLQKGQCITKRSCGLARRRAATCSSLGTSSKSLSCRHRGC